MKKYTEMTIRELEEANRIFMEQKEKLRAEQKELVRALDRKIMETEIQRKIGILSDDERAFLNQNISGVGGIKSEEKVGGLFKRILRK
jgi:hypothetical protein